MADRYLLESGAPDGYLLEDGSGVYLLESSGGGTITFVQSAHGEGTSGASPTATFSSNVTSGNLLVIVANVYRAGTPPHAFSLGDLTKSSGTATLGTAQLDIQHARANGTSSEERTAIWSIPVTGTGSLTLSLAVNAGDYANIATAEFNGADTSSGRLDTSLSNDAAGPGIGALLQIGNMTSAGAGVFVGGITAYTSVSTTWTPDGAFSTIWNEGNVAYNGSAAIYQIVASATTDSVDATLSAFDTPGWTGASVIYKAASSGGDLSLSLDTAGAITVAGQSITAAISAALSGGAITAAGQSLTFRIGEALTNGSVTIAGQSLTFATSTALGGGAITLAGQDFTLASGANLALSLDAGAITVAGQSLAFATDAALSSGTITIAGQSVALSLPSNLALALDAGAITIAGQDVAFDLQGVQPEQPTGGWGYFNDYQRERQLAAARKRRRELEDEADRLEMALAAEGLVTPSPEVVARFTVREYAPQADTFNKRTQRAIAYAERAQTALAYEMALRQVQKEIEDEESAIAMLLALVS